MSGSSEQALHDRVALGVHQLVERERGDERRGLPWPLDRGDVPLASSSLQSEERVGPRGFGERPGMAIDSDEVRGKAARACCARRPGAAAEIDERRRSKACGAKRGHDVLHEQVVQRTVEKRERGAFADALLDKLPKVRP